MAKIFTLPVDAPAKFGFKPVERRRKKGRASPGQLELFAPRVRILSLPTGLTPFEEALLLHERGDSRAAEHYRRAISRNDCTADAYCNLGIIESEAGNQDAAFDCFIQSLKHDSAHFESHYNLGNLYFETGNLRAARAHYEVASSLRRDFANLYFNLGLVQAMSDDLRGALTTLGKFRKLASESEGQNVDELLASLRESVAMQS
jgi:tetratricopeptide (TPR) repeat protein